MGLLDGTHSPHHGLAFGPVVLSPHRQLPWGQCFGTFSGSKMALRVCGLWKHRAGKGPLASSVRGNLSLAGLLDGPRAWCGWQHDDTVKDGCRLDQRVPTGGMFGLAAGRGSLEEK